MVAVAAYSCSMVAALNFVQFSVRVQLTENVKWKGHNGALDDIPVNMYTNIRRSRDTSAMQPMAVLESRLVYRRLTFS